MALLPNGYNPQNLEDVLQQSAGSASANLTDRYQQARKRTVASEAANGRLMSGVSDYPLTDLDTNYRQAQSGIETNLANEESGIPSEDWLNNKQFNRQLDLANYIGSLMQPSTLDDVFAGIGTGLKVGGSVAAMAAL